MSSGNIKLLAEVKFVSYRKQKKNVGVHNHIISLVKSFFFHHQEKQKLILTDFKPMYFNKGLAAKMRNRAWKIPSKTPMNRADEADELCLLRCQLSVISV